MFIRINSIAIFAHHGVYAEEIKNGNNFEIDLEVEVPDTLGISDVLDDALDYTKLYDTVVNVSDTKRYNLLEAFAWDICAKILRSFLEVISVKVKLRKLNAPVGGKIKFVEVEYNASRDNSNNA